MSGDALSFARWLKLMRARHDLTQKALAEQISCSVRTIEKIERAERQPSRQIAELIAEYFGIPAEEREAFLRFARSRSDIVLPGWLPQIPQLPQTQPGKEFEAGAQAAADQRQPDPYSMPGYEGDLAAAPSDKHNNLPVYRQPFISRATEVEALGALLLRPGVSLVTVTGPPGIGKTHLAVESARRMERHFRDGIYFVGLAHLNEIGQVAPAIAEALSVRDGDGRSPLEGISEYFTAKELLLVLDNFEHVIDAASQVVEMLGSQPGVKVMVTSREVLNVSPEHIFAVGSMSVPPKHGEGAEGAEGAEVVRDESAESVEGASLPDSYDAVKLFVQRAQAARPHQVFSEEDMRAIGEICAVLEGIPLSIELAATRTKLIPPRAMVERLRSRLALLTGGARDLPQRHQTLRDAIDWSYSLLTDAEALLFRRLAIFPGGCDLHAIEDVCGAGGALAGYEVEVVDLVTSLVEKSLLLHQVGEGGDARYSRYSMLETLREYAAEKLEESGETEAMRREFARYFLRLARDAEAGLRGPEQYVWLNRLEQEHTNIPAAITWAPEVGEMALLREAAPTLGQFWVRRGYWGQAREKLGELLERPEAEWQPLQRARTLYPEAYAAYLQGDYGYARTRFHESLELFRGLGDLRGAADSLNLLGFVTLMQGDKEEARRLHEESLATARAAEYRLDVPFALYGLALADIAKGDYGCARASAEESHIEARKAGDLLGIGYSLYCLGLLEYLEGNYEQAREHCARSLRTHRQIKDRRGVALALQVLGHLPEQGDGMDPQPQGADVRATQLRESLTLLCELGLKRYMPGTLAGLAILAAEQGHIERAARLLGAANALAAKTGAGVVPGQTEMYLAAERALQLTSTSELAPAVAAAQTEGAVMSFQEVIAYALDRTGVSRAAGDD